MKPKWYACEASVFAEAWVCLVRFPLAREWQAVVQLDQLLVVLLDQLLVVLLDQSAVFLRLPAFQATNSQHI